MKSWTMRWSQVLQLSVLLVGLFQARQALATKDASTSQEAGEVPVSQLRMLSLGLAHLLHGVEKNAEQLEQQGEQVAAELNGATRSLESVHKQSLQAGRTRRQVRRDLQILSARGDRLWTVVKELQDGLGDVEMEQRAIEHCMNQILKRLTIQKQAQQLASLASVVSAQDKLIDRRLQRIEHLEKLVSDGVPAALRADSDSNCV